jgi:hypothetical protein
MIETPYLLFLGDAPDQLAAKVAQGIRDWRPTMRSASSGWRAARPMSACPTWTWPRRRRPGAKTLVIGVANRGGVISQAWKKVLVRRWRRGSTWPRAAQPAARRAGPCRRGRATGGAARCARARGEVSHRQRRAAQGQALPCRGHRLLGRQDVHGAGDGSEMKARGMKSTFRATGQTGILITGDGVPLDAVVADFMAGSVEWLTPDNDDDHWDHDRGAGQPVPRVLFRGDDGADPRRQPDALILSHEPTRPHMRGCRATLPSLEALRDMALPLARIANPKACRSWASRSTPPHGRGRGAVLPGEAWRKRMGLPTVDPFRQAPGGWRCAGGAMISVTRDDVRAFALAEAFTISRGSRTEAQVLTVTRHARRRHGRGRMRALCALRRDLDSVTAQIEGLPEDISRRTCRTRCPPVRRATPSIARCGTGGEARGRAGLGTGGLPRRARRSPPSPCRSTRPRTCARRRRVMRTARF